MKAGQVLHRSRHLLLDQLFSNGELKKYQQVGIVRGALEAAIGKLGLDLLRDGQFEIGTHEQRSMRRVARRMDEIPRLVAGGVTGHLDFQRQRPATGRERDGYERDEEVDGDAEGEPHVPSQGNGSPSAYTIQLVTPHRIEAQDFLESGAIGVLRLEKLPESSSGLFLFAAAGLRGVIYQRLKRW